MNQARKHAYAIFDGRGNVVWLGLYASKEHAWFGYPKWKSPEERNVLWTRGYRAERVKVTARAAKKKKTTK